MAHFYDSVSHNVSSLVFRWNETAGAFSEHQALQTVGAWDLAAFEVGGDAYLAVASFHDGRSRELESDVYRWDVDEDRFVRHQRLPTQGAMDVEAYVDDALALLVFAGNHDGHPGGPAEAQARIFLWNGTAFGAFQTVMTSGAYDAEIVAVDGGATLLLVLVHEQDTDVLALAAAGAARAESRFVPLQRLGVAHGRDAKAFRHSGGLFLALAVFRSSVSYETDSLVYEWDAAGRRFELSQRIATVGAFDVDFAGFRGEEPFLLVASQKSGVTDLYSGGPRGWSRRASLPTQRVYDVGWHHVHEADAYYMGIARFGD